MASDVWLNVAWSVPSRTPAPTVAPPSLKVTVPLGWTGARRDRLDEGGEGHGLAETDNTTGVGAGCKATVAPALLTVSGSAESCPLAEEAGIPTVDGGNRVAAHAQRGGAEGRLARNQGDAAGKRS